MGPCNLIETDELKPDKEFIAKTFSFFEMLIQTKNCYFSISYISGNFKKNCRFHNSSKFGFKPS